jgi:hypothetical protein
MLQIIYGIQIKLEFKFVYKQEQGIWLGKYQMQFITPSSSFENS